MTTKICQVRLVQNEKNAFSRIGQATPWTNWITVVTPKFGQSRPSKNENKKISRHLASSLVAFPFATRNQTVAERRSMRCSCVSIWSGLNFTTKTRCRANKGRQETVDDWCPTDQTDQIDHTDHDLVQIVYNLTCRYKTLRRICTLVVQIQPRQNVLLIGRADYMPPTRQSELPIHHTRKKIE